MHSPIRALCQGTIETIRSKCSNSCIIFVKFWNGILWASRKPVMDRFIDFDNPLNNLAERLPHCLSMVGCSYKDCHIAYPWLVAPIVPLTDYSPTVSLFALVDLLAWWHVSTILCTLYMCICFSVLYPYVYVLAEHESVLNIMQWRITTEAEY